MSTHTRQHTLLRADERLGPNDKVPRPLNTSKIELWGGHDTPTADPPAPPVSTTISRSLNQTRTGAEATEPPSAPGLPTQTQEAGKHLPWTVETHKPTHTPTRSVTTHTHTRDEANMEEVKVTITQHDNILDLIWIMFVVFSD